ncbi:J domain-containing protein [Endozoicomonas sp. SM1973]|uniref:J domain-containing protein n=1 Tax=Spartinivicinus marinus TaxID=2994442 RepID=A0A853I7L2_9GAMM|nr:J domain-containing protein [Spartinivicinus marinus]MCX4029191.1 J domain-containing protein [Spartinivicinus marinus]NYZ65901.1 J domain-containing protein [Spartinivicinus marinus]
MAKPSRQQLLAQLKLPPNATLEDIKRAYRYHAKRLHPDKNPSQDTTEAFQQLQQTYRLLVKDFQQTSLTLSESHDTSAVDITEQVKRNQQQLAKTYGVNTSIEKPPHLSSTASSETTILPTCQRCGQCKINLTKRQFCQVIGLLYKSRQRQVEGIWCLSCSWRLSLWYNCLNLILGWWSLPAGPWHTLKAFWYNATKSYQPKKQLELLVTLVNALYQQHDYGKAVNFAYQLLSSAPPPNRAIQHNCYRLLDNLGNPLKPPLPNLFPWYWPVSHGGLILFLLILITSPLVINIALQRSYLPSEPFKIRPTPLYTNERLGLHYTLTETKLYTAANLTSPVKVLLGSYHPIKVTKVINKTWLQVTYNNKRYFTREALIGFGNARTAKKLKCNQYPQRKPFSGELMGKQVGQQSLKLTNLFKQDTVITFYQGKHPVQKAFINASTTAVLPHLPAGITHLSATFGKFYNQACGQFTYITGTISQNITLFGQQAELSLKPSA